jgi:hypothetical protein
MVAPSPRNKVEVQVTKGKEVRTEDPPSKTAEKHHIKCRRRWGMEKM